MQEEITKSEGVFHILREIPPTAHHLLTLNITTVKKKRLDNLIYNVLTGI